ncbi:MAG: hypothetical protein OXG39_05840 [Chloroflexi bacterium]|nr:hypothetical protein [Chloroflexota bacterium]
MPKTILPEESQIYRCFVDLIGSADRVIFAGLPGVGKSLLLQQLTLMALDAGRAPHLFQWDTARQPFESPRFPLERGATHPMVIKATGVWLRGALLDWDKAHSHRDAILIGEAPLIGGRFMEIVRRADDEAESLLADRRSQFVLPVPSRRVRALIEQRREASIANPAHENEAQDAPPDLLRALWQDLYQVALQLGIVETGANDAPYSPEIYEAVYRQLLRHRRVRVLAIDEPLRPVASVYDFEAALPQLIADREGAQALLREIEATTSIARLRRDAARWYQL